MLRAGVIGVGNMGSRHARVYASSGDMCVLAGIFDQDEVRAAQVAGRWGTRVYSSIEELLDNVDVVSIASPAKYHFEHAVIALNKGVDILIEKPVILTPQQGRRLEKLANRQPRHPVIQVGHIEHFNPAIGELRKLLATEHIVAIDIQRLGPQDKPSQDTDVVQDLMIHDIHVLLTLVPSPLKLVQAVGRAIGNDAQIDYAIANLVFQNGVIATLSASRITEEKIRRLSVTTLDAYITVDYLQKSVNICRRTRLSDDSEGSRTYRQESIIERVFVPMEEPLVAEIRDFLRCVKERKTPQVPLAMGIRCLDLVEAIRSKIAVSAKVTKETGVGVA